MSTLKERLAIASQVAEAMGKKVYNNVEHDLKAVSYTHLTLPTNREV